MQPSNNTDTPMQPHHATHAWTYRIPSPPRVVVPPPSLDTDGLPHLSIRSDFVSEFDANGVQVQMQDDPLTVTANHMLDWKYEQRRMAQQIVPHIYLGPMSAARDRDYLQREGITMVMAIRDTKSAQARLLGSKAATALGIENITLDVAGNQELIAAFPRAIHIISRHISSSSPPNPGLWNVTSERPSTDTQPMPRKILLYCESGNERSASVAAAYIMAKYARDFISAIQIVQAHRFCVSFDDALKFLLQTYDSILQAKKDTGSRDTTSGQDVGQAKTSIKRNLEEALDDEMELDGNFTIDEGRFEGREIYAPFSDHAMS